MSGHPSFKCNCFAAIQGHAHPERLLALWLIDDLADRGWCADNPDWYITAAQCRIGDVCEHIVQDTWDNRDGWEWIRDETLFVLVQYADEYGPPRAYDVYVDCSPTFYFNQAASANQCNAALRRS